MVALEDTQESKNQKPPILKIKGYKLLTLGIYTVIMLNSASTSVRKSVEQLTLRQPRACVCVCIMNAKI